MIWWQFTRCEYYRYSQQYKGFARPPFDPNADMVKSESAHDVIPRLGTRILGGIERAADEADVPWFLLESFAYNFRIRGYGTFWLRAWDDTAGPQSHWNQPSRPVGAWREATALEVCRVLYAEKAHSLNDLVQRGIQFGEKL